MNPEDIRAINQELSQLQLRYFKELAELQKRLTNLEMRTEAHGQDISRGKSELENSRLLLKPLADMNVRIKKLEDSHSSLKPTITISAPQPIQTGWFKKYYRKT